MARSQIKREPPGERALNLRRSAASPSEIKKAAISAAATSVQAPDDRAKRMTALLDAARALTSELNLPEVVHQVLIRAIVVIPAADAGTLYLLDPASGRLVVSDSMGFGPSIFKLSLEPGEAAAGHALVSGRGAIYPNPEAVYTMIDNATPETGHQFRAASQGPRSPKAAMTAPLIFKGTLLGVLVVDAIRSRGNFSADDLGMLEDFAQIASTAIVNARLYSGEQANRLRLEVLHDEVTRQRDELDRRISGLDSMAEIARQGLGLEALASRLAHLTASRVYILDGLVRMRASSGGQPEQRLKELLESEPCDALLRRVSDDHHPRSAIVGCTQLVISPIVRGIDLLGYVIVEADEPASARVNEALADVAALIASTTLVHERALEEGTAQRRVELLERLLDGDVPNSTASFRALSPPLRLAVGRLRPSGAGGRARVAEENVLREVRAIAEQSLETLTAPMAAVVRSGYVVLAWSVPQGEDRRRAGDKLERVAAAVMATSGARIRFALSELISDPYQVSQVYQEARLAVEIRPCTESAVVDAGGLGAYRLIIAATSSRDVMEFSRRTLAEAIEHDRTHRGCLIATLRAYLEKGLSPSVAAHALGIHVHTVQYRLNKLTELTGLSIHNAEERLTLELALRVLDMSSAGPSPSS